MKRKRSRNRRSIATHRQHDNEQTYHVWEMTSVIESDAGEELAVLEYEITDEPLEYDWFKRLPLDAQHRIIELHDLALTDPYQVIEEAQSLLEKYPYVPMLYNFLGIAYASVGDRANRQTAITTCQQKFPDYVFGKIAQAQLYLDNEEPEKVPELLEGKLELQRLYPQRTRFHISEYMGFTGLMVLYYSHIGERARAKQYYRILRKIVPKHPMLRQIRRALFVYPIVRILRQIERRLSIWSTPQRASRMRRGSKSQKKSHS